MRLSTFGLTSCFLWCLLSCHAIVDARSSDNDDSVPPSKSSSSSSSSSSESSGSDSSYSKRKTSDGSPLNLDQDSDATAYKHFIAHNKTMTCSADEHALPFNNQIRGTNLGGWLVLEVRREFG